MNMFCGILIIIKTSNNVIINNQFYLTHEISYLPRHRFAITGLSCHSPRWYDTTHIDSYWRWPNSNKFYCGIGTSFTLHLIVNFHCTDERKIISYRTYCLLLPNYSPGIYELNTIILKQNIINVKSIVEWSIDQTKLGMKIGRGGRGIFAYPDNRCIKLKLFSILVTMAK